MPFAVKLTTIKIRSTNNDILRKNSSRKKKIFLFFVWLSLITLRYALINQNFDGSSSFSFGEHFRTCSIQFLYSSSKSDRFHLKNLYKWKEINLKKFLKSTRNLRRRCQRSRQRGRALFLRCTERGKAAD